MANKRPEQPTPEAIKANALSRWEGEGGARPATGNGTPVRVRLQPDQLAALDTWRAAQPGPPSRPEAIRTLMERGLKGEAGPDWASGSPD
jgi:hypothetical protein